MSWVSVAGFDDVLGAGVGDLGVNDQELSVVAKIGALVDPLPGLDGQHRHMRHRQSIKLGPELLVSANASACDLVIEHPNGDVATSCSLKSVEEVCRDGVEAHDVKLDVDGAGRLLNGAGHVLE